MPLDIEIPDSNIEGFNTQACNRLKASIYEYTNDLIEEANRIESGRNTTSGKPEITSSMVNDANVLVRRGLTKPKKGLMIKVLRVASILLPLIVGILYNSNKLQDSAYLVFFIILISLTIMTVTISVMKD